MSKSDIDNNLFFIKGVWTQVQAFFLRYNTRKEIFMYFTSNDHVKLHFTDTREKWRIPIICVPGIGASSLLFNPLKTLLNQKYRVITMDPRNQGQSERTYAGQQIFRLGMDLAELISHLNLKNVILIGNSMGAGVIWSYLALFTSKNVQAIVDLDQPPKMIRDETWAYGFKELAWSNFPDYLRQDLGRATYKRVDRKLASLAKEDYRLHPFHLEDDYDLLINHAVQDWRSLLIDLKIPMLVLAGKNSPYFDYNFAEITAGLNVRFSYQVIDDCGHVVHAEQPEKCYQLISEFFEKEGINNGSK